MIPSDAQPEELIEAAARGDAAARAELLAHYRQRLRHMVALHLDQRLQPRIDPSDVVQEAMIEAHRRLTEYLEERPIPFYPWLRKLAFNRLVDLHRRHLMSQKRSVLREARTAPAADDNSLAGLAEHFVASATSPSGRAVREEDRDRVRAALLQLAERDREILVLRYLERLCTEEVAAVLGISAGAVKVRHFRALERIRKLLETPAPEIR